MNVIVDTCVIIDALANREPFAEAAQALCLTVANDKITGFIPAKSVADIYYIMHRYFHSNAETRALLKKLFMSFGILDTTALDCRNALTSPISDFEDAILAETAYRCGVDYIVTRNTKDFARSVVPVVTAEEVMEILRETVKEE
ncbi:MAG: PIN domain-containing protein [Oscillospiraceae bacterium]|nr:PIN domain-containing protein [Oscillospiraceae bacterium]